MANHSLIKECYCVIGLVGKKQILSFLLSYNRPKRVFFSPQLPTYFRNKDVRDETCSIADNQIITLNSMSNNIIMINCLFHFDVIFSNDCRHL